MKAARLIRLSLGIVFAPALVVAADPQPANGIQVYSGNPFYWQYAGKPVLLLGGSSAPKDALNDEGMFLWPDVVGSLDRLVAVGGNYTRCLMSGRLRGEPLWPFRRVDGTFDLDRWDDHYWRCFETFLEETKKRGVVTDIEVWATFDYARLPWTKNPFNPVNNRNYTAGETGLPAEVKSHPCLAENVFYHTLPADRNVARVLEYQKRFVDKILSYTLQFDHVLYCMDNETGGSPTWGAYWAGYIREAAAKVGRKVYQTEMFESHDLANPVYLNVMDHPELYDFIEISQNNHQSGQAHFDKTQLVRQRIVSAPRPITNVKIYGSEGSGQFGSAQEGVDRFWRNIFGGCASARFHEKHLGDSDLALRMIRSARALTAAFDLFRCAPHNDLLVDRGTNQAYCLANPGKEYAVYFPAEGGVQLKVRDWAAALEVRWYDIDHGDWMPATQGPAQTELTSLPLATPGAGRWVVVVRKKSS